MAGERSNDHEGNMRTVMKIKLRNSEELKVKVAINNNNNNNNNNNVYLINRHY